MFSVPQASNIFMIGGQTVPPGATGAGNPATVGAVVPANTSVCSLALQTQAGATAHNFVSFIPMGTFGAGAAGAGYKVSSGKKLLVPGFYWLSGAALGTQILAFGYSTSAPAALNTATTPTGAVFFSGAEDSYQLTQPGGPNVLTWVPITMQFPADSYPWIQTATAGQAYYIWMTGYEV